eukprot:TRINITY_DN1011_c0_g1_i1.p1 TRINITY_DN1011_c0_g1~~TRINITY_DN1011_c0_g1_i1.p1  ORF type:complete len:519 (-),score=150.70 TRINITY_DN1011_c0_g1_i1:1032-2588(-)
MDDIKEIEDTEEKELEEKELSASDLEYQSLIRRVKKAVENIFFFSPSNTPVSIPSSSSSLPNNSNNLHNSASNHSLSSSSSSVHASDESSSTILTSHSAPSISAVSNSSESCSSTASQSSDSPRSPSSNIAYSFSPALATSAFFFHSRAPLRSSSSATEESFFTLPSPSSSSSSSSSPSSRPVHSSSSSSSSQSVSSSSFSSLTLHSSQMLINELCASIESIFTHHLLSRSPSLFSTSNSHATYWPYVRQVVKSLPNMDKTREAIKLIERSLRTNEGRGRAFIRLALNEGSVTEYMQALRFNTSLTSEYYDSKAIICQDDKMEETFQHFDKLKLIKFKLKLADKCLEDQSIWPTGTLDIEVLQSLTEYNKKTKFFFSKRKKSKNKWTQRDLEVSQNALEVRKLLIAGVPDHYRSVIWRSLSCSLPVLLEKRKPDLYMTLIRTPSSYEDKIKEDIGRTLSSISFFGRQETKMMLSNVLHAFSVFNPELGYSQEMSFIAGVLLLELEEEVFFDCLSVMSL